MPPIFAVPALFADSRLLLPIATSAHLPRDKQPTSPFPVSFDFLYFVVFRMTETMQTPAAAVAFRRRRLLRLPPAPLASCM